MKVFVQGIGFWSSLCADIDVFNRMDLSKHSLVAEGQVPEASIIPARERRRVPFISRAAIAAGIEGCDSAGVSPMGVATVFSSAMSDTEVTDYMCRVLATPEKAMSPTRFHNSVHNATSGYWSIYTGGTAAGTFVGAFRQSFAAGLFEAASFALAEGLPTLLVVYDVVDTLPMYGACPIDYSLAYSLVLAPGRGKQSSRCIDLSLAPSVDSDVVENSHPTAHGLALITALRERQSAQQRYQLGQGTLRVDIMAGDALGS